MSFYAGLPLPPGVLTTVSSEHQKSTLCLVQVFDIAPEGVRKCIVSTNIAETSVTIDGVRFIVDSGKVKEMSYDANCKMQRLQEFWISRASSEQRKGRAGRTGPGVCFRLYSESDYHEFQEYSTPEILRVPLDSLVLQMVSMGLPDARLFPFIEPPAQSSLENAILFLKDQGALSAEEQLTPIGSMLAQLPVEVTIGKVLIMGVLFDMVEHVLTLAGVLSVQSPYTSRAHTSYEATTARQPLDSEHGDPFSLLNAYNEWLQVKSRRHDSRKWCRRRGLEEQRFYELTKLRGQFASILREHHLIPGAVPRSSDARGDRGRDSRPQGSGTLEERVEKSRQRRELVQLRRKHRLEGKKRKMLKVEDGFDHQMELVAAEEHEMVNDDDDGDDEKKAGGHHLEAKIRDLEFRVTHDMKQVEERAIEGSSLTGGELNLLKIIICSGLYPQVAIADESNSFRANSEQVFHTRRKPGILLHPNSIYGTHPHYLQLEDSGADNAESKRPEVDSRHPMSSRHNLLAYISLLETTKPYLTGLMRVPALQTLLLFASEIDTNADFTRLVIDSWIELRLANQESAEEAITILIRLREMWSDLIGLYLESIAEDGQSAGKMRADSVEENSRILAKRSNLRHSLGQAVSKFLSSNVRYSIKRLLSADQKLLYVGPGENATETDCKEGSSAYRSTVESMFSSDSSKAHPTKGGVMVNGYLTYNCLLGDDDSSLYGQYTVCMQRHWTCPHCQESLVVTLVERLQHESLCKQGSVEKGGTSLGERSEVADSEQSCSGVVGGREYWCEACSRTYTFTTAEIFRHRKSHTTATGTDS